MRFDSRLLLLHRPDNFLTSCIELLQKRVFGGILNYFRYCNKIVATIDKFKLIFEKICNELAPKIKVKWIRNSDFFAKH